MRIQFLLYNEEAEKDERLKYETQISIVFTFVYFCVFKLSFKGWYISVHYNLRNPQRQFLWGIITDKMMYIQTEKRFKQ